MKTISIYPTLDHRQDIAIRGLSRAAINHHILVSASPGEVA